MPNLDGTITKANAEAAGARDALVAYGYMKRCLAVRCVLPPHSFDKVVKMGVALANRFYSQGYYSPPPHRFYSE